MSAATVEDASYTVEDGDLVRDRDAVVGVWRDTLAQAEGRADKFDWFYRDAPEGSLLQALRHGPERTIVGAAGVGWRRMRIGDRELRAGLLADMAVLADHRLLGPALALQRATCERALSEGDLIYGFPNRNAVPVVKRLGYMHVGDMVLYVRVLRYGAYLVRRLPPALAAFTGGVIDGLVRMRDGTRRLLGSALHASWHDTAPGALFDSRRPSTLEGVRDTATLDWRFTRCPLTKFRFLHLRRSGQSEPCAWFACHHDGNTLRIADFAIAEGTSLSRALADVASAGYALGCRSLAIECCLPEDEARAFREHGFHERQRRPLYARWSKAAPQDLQWRLTLYDEDE